MKAHITNVRITRTCNTTCKYVDICPLASKCDEFQEYNDECESKLWTHRRHGKNRRKHREFRHKRLSDMIMETLEEVLTEGSKGTIFDPKHIDYDKPFNTKFVDFKTGETISDEAIRKAFLEMFESCDNKSNKESNT